MSNEQEREAFENMPKCSDCGYYCLSSSHCKELRARAALDTHKQSISYELNQQGLEAAANVINSNALKWDKCYNAHYLFAEAAIQAYLPYHNADVGKMVQPSGVKL